MRPLLVFFAFLFFVSTGVSAESRRVISALELQEELQRFASTFMARMYEVFQPPKETVSNRTFHTMQTEGLFYASSALDLATGPYPEANLLDMLAFITLTRQNLEDYWIPKVYGKSGRDALRAFQKSEKEIWNIAAQVASVEQLRLYREAIQDWKKENPELRRTDAIRLSGVYQISGQADSARAKKVSGILGSIAAVVATTDQAVLLSQRAMFLAQRAPVLLRIHARIGAREIVSDTLDELGRSEQLIGDLQTLSATSGQTLQRMETLSKEMSLEKLKTTERIVTKANQLSENLLSLSSKKMNFERMIYVFFGMLLLSICVWWLGYVWARKRV